MKKIVLDGRLLTTKNRLYEHLDEAFDFPDHFGNNLDALWDVLNETSEKRVVHFTHITKFIEETDGYGEKVLELFMRLNQLNNTYEVHLYPYGLEEE